MSDADKPRLVVAEPNLAPSAGGGIEQVIVPRTRDLGGFAVRRALPVAGRRMVGPFIFLDQMGPAEFPIGEGVDVRPHPHIGLATVTYLFDGAIDHRDSLGTVQTIYPGDVNWMSAGRGITHSERTGPQDRLRGARLSGLQLWVALPKEHEDSAPFFAHHETTDLPIISDGGARVRLIAGEAYGVRSPVVTAWDTVFADIALEAGARVPIDAATEERALYLVDGIVEIAGDRFEPGRLLVLRPSDTITVEAVTAARFSLIGGATMDGPRHIWWNFVSSSTERLEQAKADWKAGRFSPVPGETDFIPLPEFGG